jgi:hypothetical protein
LRADYRVCEDDADLPSAHFRQRGTLRSSQFGP